MMILFDFVEWPVEPSAPIHILTPSPYLRYVNGTFLVACDRLTLCGPKVRETHERHHGSIVVVRFINSFPILVWQIRSIWV